MMARLMMCFGWWGLLSTLAWLAALAAGAACLRREPRQRRFAGALGLAVAGFLFAKGQVAWEQAIVLDRTEELRAVRLAQRQLQMREEREHIAQGENVVRFAEDAPGESAGGAIQTADELTGRTTATTNAVQATNTVPAYMAGGRQSRTAGKVDPQAARLARMAVQNTGGADENAPPRTLKLADYRLAGRLSHANRLLAELVLLAVFGIAVGDYLRRFNHPVDACLPLPIAGTWLTHFSPAPALVSWPGATDTQLRVFLEDIALRGQTFLYVGDRPEAGVPAFHRIRLGRLRAWPLPVLTWGRAGTPADAEFALDAVWFNRYAMRVPSEAADKLLPPLLDLLAGRAAVHATAASLPHLIWDAGRPFDPQCLQRLARLCTRTGLRLMLVGTAAPDPIAGGFLSMPPAGAQISA